MKPITIHRSDGSTYEIYPEQFHSAPYEEVSLECKDPTQFVNFLIDKYENLKKEIEQEEQFFPGNTNFVGNSFYSVKESLDSLLYFLKMIHYKNETL